MGRLLKYKRNIESKHKRMKEKDMRFLSDFSTVAKVFLSIEEMTHKKLQKVCYYAYAFVLSGSNGGMKLFDNNFKAWIHGPVCPALHAEYSQYGVNDVIPRAYEHGCSSESIVGFLIKIYEVYGKYTADELEEMSHNEKPWSKAREGKGKYQYSGNVISDEDIIEYY